MTRFILASASPRRLSLLADIGVAPDEVIPAACDETPYKGERPRALAERLALEKGRVIADLHPDAMVLAADTVVACGRRVLPKAETEDDVRTCLTLLSGRRHHVYTAVAVFTPDGLIRHRLSDSRVAFKRLSPEEIDAYVASGEGIGKAGGYAIQGKAATLIRSISGSYSGIVGLPLFETASLFPSLS
ncbi:MAG: nucleoside triphosphate pyrophosphatase [Bdellovibrionales bacterium]